MANLPISNNWYERQENPNALVFWLVDEDNNLTGVAISATKDGIAMQGCFPSNPDAGTQHRQLDMFRELVAYYDKLNNNVVAKYKWDVEDGTVI